MRACDKHTDKRTNGWKTDKTVRYTDKIEEHAYLSKNIMYMSLFQFHHSGFIVYTFNIARFGEDEAYRYSAVRQCLQNSISKEQFVEKMQQRCSGTVQLK